MAWSKYDLLRAEFYDYLRREFPPACKGLSFWDVLRAIKPLITLNRVDY